MGVESAFRDLPRATRSPIPEACSIFSYKDERIWRLVWSIKYKRSRAGTTIAGYALHRVLRSYLAAMPSARAVPKILIVPMPITSRRRRERGFNQCELLADEIERLSSNWNVGGVDDAGDESKIGGRLIIVRDLLIRKIHTSRQTLKDRAARLESVKDIFVVNEKAAERIKNDTHFSGDTMIIIIDDVITTGGTIRDAVETLRKAGFERTFGLSVAH
jgi:predicted amidophosphoribosyltransferase